jgi:hypothetical protein
MALQQSILVDPIPPTPYSTTPAVRIRWIRDHMHAYTRDLALHQALGDDHPFGAHSAYVETFDAACGIGKICDAGFTEINAAHEAEWREASANALAVIDAIRKRVWPLGVAHVAGDAIIKAARTVCDAHATFIPDDLLIPHLRLLCQRANRKPRRRR